MAIPSVSSEIPERLPDIQKMMEWTKAHADRLGAKTKLIPNPVSTQERELPPILCGEWHVSDELKTLCVYGHLDVQPAEKSDGWATDPFVLTEKDGKLFGRGSTDDKGPALSWLWIVEAHQEMGIQLPVNLKILYEGMEEYGSEGLFETIQEEAKKGGFLNDVVSNVLFVIFVLSSLCFSCFDICLHIIIFSLFFLFLSVGLLLYFRQLLVCIACL